MDTEILITISAYDDTFAQTIHTRYSYKWHEIKKGFKFLPMYHTDNSGVVILELDKINEMQEATLPKTYRLE
jgi:inward rectifier potassium channel